MRPADAEPLHAGRAYAARRAVKGAPLRSASLRDGARAAPPLTAAAGAACAPA